MSISLTDPPISIEPTAPVMKVKRRTIDAILVSFGLLATLVFAVAGGLLTWGNSFSSDYVHRELSSQKISFPSADELKTEGRDDLVKYADQPLDSGKKAEAYASFIDGHLQKIGGGLTYAEIGVPEAAAKADVTAATAAGQPQAEIDTLKAKAAGITAQRDSLFKGETLRGLLLSAYAWSTVGMIAGLAAIGAFIASALMAMLTLLGFIHYLRTAKS